MNRLCKKMDATISLGYTQTIHTIEQELSHYFTGELKKFETPLFLNGSPFQKDTWIELQKIPFGETRSYFELAQAVGKKGAWRAVAQANRANQFAIMIPCHRVIHKNGEIGGYAGGVYRKKYLLEWEKA